MKAESSRYYPKKNKIITSILWAISLCVFFISVPIHATTSGDPYKYRESGELSSIEDGNSVIINSNGYDIDPSVLVVNLAGRPTSLDKLSLPVNVNFEWSYMPMGPKTMAPVIVYIEEAKEIRKEKRSAQ